MKLSDAQKRVMDKAKEEIDQARSCESVEEYFIKHLAIHYNHRYDTPEKMKDRDLEGWNNQISYYENLKSGLVLTMCNSKTLKKLQDLGLIEIIKDSNGQTYGIDVVRVLNY